MIKNIQILRAWASIIVVLYHALGTAASYSQTSKYFSMLGSWGIHGVDIFFVISGFIMYYTQVLKDNKPSKFIKDRMIRIVPIYWILTSFYLGLYFFVPSLFRDYKPSMEYILSSYFFITGPLYNEHPILSYGWTLEYEAIFYLVFFIVLFFSNRLYFALASFLLVLAYIFIPNLSIILLEFTFGMVIAVIYTKFNVNRYSGLIFGTGVILLISSIFFNVKESNRLILFGFPSALIVYGLLGLKEFRCSVLLFLGSASYSIYLIHVFTLPLFYKFSSKFMIDFNFDLLIIFSVLFTIFVGCIFYIVVEKPITIFLKKRFC